MSDKKVITRACGVIIVAIALFVSRQFIVEKPVIGIPHTTQADYAEAVTKAGGIPVILPYDNEKIPEHLTKLDGILFPGGADVPPTLYGEEEIHPTVKTVSDERLEFEYDLAKLWLKETDKPYLGICLGCQMLNVVQGGSLIQDIPSEFGADHRVDHDVEIVTGSKIYSIFGKEVLSVNSRHHQAVRNLGEGLKVAAKSPDGIIEAIELMSDRFVVGVQWHPEKLKDNSDQEKLFRQFIEAAASQKALQSK
ncbi:MAG: gamma-glutamyl-gamma-aminobutyrate hydrolase family protein [Verrucomicrobiales bacterium]|nr:gamma-glutamyl-gamma-aminobutyrate hydrolase family protein [Verrucomicrobiales bacterium]